LGLFYAENIPPPVGASLLAMDVRTTQSA